MLRYGMVGLSTVLALAALPSAHAAKSGGTLNFAVVAEPPNYDCHASTTFALIHPIAPHYSTLLKFDGPKYPAVVGDLAKSWSIAPDGKTYTFTLHQPVRFHDGSALTSADIKASYDRIANPPVGIVSARRAFWADLDGIDTPNPATVSFRFKAPVAGMLEHFANPYNCVYSAAKLSVNPRYPESEIMGSGAFKFVTHVKGSAWEGQKFDQYFQSGLPYLDGYKAYFVKNTAVVPGLLGGQFSAEFRGQNPKERDQLMAGGSDRFAANEGTWVGALMLVFNTKKKPFDDVRVRQALSLAIDRWGGSAPLSKISILKGVGGVQRPGATMALPEAELVKLPGWGRDIEAARVEARRLLKEAGVENLTLKLLNRNVAEPYTPGGIYVIDQLKRIGVTAQHEQLETKLYFDGVASGNFDVAIEFINDPNDDPTQQFAKYVSRQLSSIGYSGHTDERLDQLYEAQRRAVVPSQRIALVHDLERHALTQAYNVPLLWYHRIVVMDKTVKGWHFTPSHYVQQDLTTVWLDR
jgi:peptide/nickel transport system substrate-binding protein